MDRIERVRQWLEAGRQVGKWLSFLRAGEAYCLSIGVQKWQDSYKLQLVEYPDDLSYDTESTREEQLSFPSFEELEQFFSTVPTVSLVELAPLKGRKIFTPGSW